MILLRDLIIEQPDFQWQYQLRHERDVTAQFQAIQALQKYPTNATRLALTDTIESDHCFYKVRCQAAHSLTKVANQMVASWSGPPAMLNIFRKFFGSFSAPHIIKLNNFSNFQLYFLQKAIPVAMAGEWIKCFFFFLSLTIYSRYRLTHLSWHLSTRGNAIPLRSLQVQ